jgi:carbon monoxide dehydrogenase subunit G
VSTVLDAPPEKVWARLEDVRTHVDWMEDAVAIRITSQIDRGVGTTFDCDTKIGPFRLTDRMEITEWVDGEVMGVRHVGIVTGTGRFTLTPVGASHTEFTWEEQLQFPWWMGGPVGAVAGSPVLKQVWKRNLKALAALVAGS